MFFTLTGWMHPEHIQWFVHWFFARRVIAVFQRCISFSYNHFCIFAGFCLWLLLSSSRQFFIVKLDYWEIFHSSVRGCCSTLMWSKVCIVFGLWCSTSLLYIIISFMISIRSRMNFRTNVYNADLKHSHQLHMFFQCLLFICRRIYTSHSCNIKHPTSVSTFTTTCVIIAI